MAPVPAMGSGNPVAGRTASRNRSAIPLRLAGAPIRVDAVSAKVPGCRVTRSGRGTRGRAVSPGVCAVWAGAAVCARTEPTFPRKQTQQMAALAPIHIDIAAHFNSGGLLPRKHPTEAGMLIGPPALRLVHDEA